MTEPEIWKPIIGFPGYEVSDAGKVKSSMRSKASRIMRPMVCGAGYHAVTLCAKTQRKRRYVHHLVLETFIGACPKGLEACHGNGNPTDNRLANLRWDTHASNQADKVLHGTNVRGEQNGGAKLKESQVFAIYSDTGSCKTLGRKFGVGAMTVSRIKRGEIWAWLTGAK